MEETCRQADPSQISCEQYREPPFDFRLCLYTHPRIFSQITFFFSFLLPFVETLLYVCFKARRKLLFIHHRALEIFIHLFFFFEIKRSFLISRLRFYFSLYKNAIFAVFESLPLKLKNIVIRNTAVCDIDEGQEYTPYSEK